MPKLTPKQFKQYKNNCGELYLKLDGRCQNCNLFIVTPTNLNFAHVDTRKHMSVDEVLTKFVFVCKELHTYEHTLANNLKENLCVKLFLDKYFNGYKRKYFWQLFIQEKELFQDD